MKNKFALLGCALMIAAVMAIWSAPVQATTFNFNDMYYVSSLTTFHSIFGAATTGYGTAGIYQETNTTTPTVTKLSNGSGVPGEYVENTTTNATQFLSLNGWSQSLNNGQQVASVYNLGNPTNGAIYFQYRVGTTSGSAAGGTLTPFTFNGFDLRGATANANLSFTLEGFLGGNLVDSAILNVTGNSFQTFTENWLNVDTVEIVSTGTLPVNWGSGTLYMDNVKINDSFSAVPVPPSAMLLGTGLLGLVGLGWRRKKPSQA
jgi:hypothetical protein